jgi:rSAM/selenodomain-associated transferase 1
VEQLKRNAVDKAGNGAVILFTRAPIPGQTKTRLQKLLTPEECAQMHICFLMDLKICCEQTGIDYFVFLTPEGEDEKIAEIFGHNVKCLPQQGDGLGIRMYNAISEVLSMGYDSCVLMGADIPEMKAGDIMDAFAVLKDRDVVLCPTRDGGYCLVGMKKPCAAVFEDQTYGCGSVLENATAAIEAAGLTCGLIKAHDDIDEPEDILSYQEKADRKEISGNTHASKYIAELVEKYKLKR